MNTYKKIKDILSIDTDLTTGLTIGIILGLGLIAYTLLSNLLCSIYTQDYQLTAIYLGIIIFIATGFFLPKHKGKAEKKNLSKTRRLEDKKKWGFNSRERNNIWLNFIDRPIIKKTYFATGRKFYSEWLIIHDGLIIVNPGPSKIPTQNNTVEYDYKVQRTYAWDGCSPKIWFYWFALIGTPDWKHHKETISTLDKDGNISRKEKFWQMAHHASLVHDALYQYLGEHPITKHEADLLFYEMLCESGMNLITAKIYHFAVICGGGKEIKKHHRPGNTCFKDVTMPEEHKN